jgi:hypothetical protein
MNFVNNATQGALNQIGAITTVLVNTSMWFDEIYKEEFNLII